MVKVTSDNKYNVLKFICNLAGEGVAVPVHSALGQYEDEALTAGVIYHNNMGNDIGASIGVAKGHVLSRKFVFAMYDFPFRVLHVNRITVRIRESNYPSIKLAGDFGFSLEGVIRQGYRDGEDMLLFGMLKQECRWLRLAKRYGGPTHA